MLPVTLDASLHLHHDIPTLGATHGDLPLHLTLLHSSLSEISRCQSKLARSSVHLILLVPRPFLTPRPVLTLVDNLLFIEIQTNDSSSPLSYPPAFDISLLGMQPQRKHPYGVDSNTRESLK